MTLDEGVIKFDFSDFKQTNEVNFSHFKEIESFRSKLFEMKLIGFYEEHQVGYGNISQRFDLSGLKAAKLPQFIISGTQTGHIPNLTQLHYTYVLGYDLAKNKIISQGPILPSSESLTHAAIYECDKEITAVIHIHDTKIWAGMIKENMLFTAKNIPYGTIQMANAVKDIVTKNYGQAFAMAGHDDGVIAYGKNLEDAFYKIDTLYKRFHS